MLAALFLAVAAPFLELDAPIDRWVDAIPLGNGQAGALVWGDGDELRFTLDRADYWHQERNPMLDDPTATWRNLTAWTNDIPGMLAKYVIRKDPCKLPGVRLVAKLPKDVSCRKFTLDIRDGSSEIVLAGPTGECRLTAWFEDDSPYLSLAVPDGFRFASMAFTTNAAFARLGGYPEPRVEISEKGAFYHRGNRPSAKGAWARDFSAGVRILPREAQPKSAFWPTFWKVSSVTIPDARLQHFYDFAMYCYGAASRPPHPPIALQALWTADNGDLPPWHGDYHMDLNVQETYWAAPVAGHLDALDAYADLMVALLPAFRDYGRAFFGMRDGAAAIPGHMAYDGTFIAGGPMWAFPLTHGLWGFAEVYNAWAYCPTRERLDRIWPLAWALAKGVDQVLLPPDAAGVRRYALSGSPEIGTDGEIGGSRRESFLPPNSTYDRTVTRCFLRQVERLAIARGDTAAQCAIADLVRSLGPAHLDAHGRHLVAPGMPLARSHLHLSHLHDVFPFFDVEDGVDAAASVRQFLSLGRKGWAGHTLPELACKCAAVALGDDALDCLNAFAGRFTARNGFHLNYFWQEANAPDRRPSDVFTLEANLAFARGVQEMLLSGRADVLAVFPALPGAWKGKAVSFRELVVPGGHRVSARRAPDGSICGSVTAFADATLTLVFPDGSRHSLSARRGVPVEFAQAARTLDIYRNLMPLPRRILPAGTPARITVSQLARPAVSFGRVDGAIGDDVADQAYRISIAPDGVRITAGGAAGARYARITLEQLAKLSDDGTVPAAEIVDWPDVKWRGVMNDCGRNFLAIEGVKAIVDLAARYKMNLFHWHLADYHGWRLESKRHPQLTAPETMMRQIGKYYTQGDFKDVVAYAAARGITVMPELDIPGHTLALRKGLGVASMKDPRVGPAVADLIDELCALAPKEVMPFIHLGTDEVRVSAEYVEPGQCSRWAEVVAKNGRTTVAWAPGEKMSSSGEIVDMVWHRGHETNTTRRCFDSVGFYFGSLGPERLLGQAYRARACDWRVAPERKLGAIACCWHDDAVGDDTMRLFDNTAFAPALVALADNFWCGRDGSRDLTGLMRLEDRLLAQRDKVLRGVAMPFPYVRQTMYRWRVTDAVTGRVVNPCHIGGYLDCESLVTNRTGCLVAETWIKSPSNQTVGAWIDFENTGVTYQRAYSRPRPKRGEWSPLGSTVEVNGEQIAPPAWRHPGVRSTYDQCPRDGRVRMYRDVPYSDDVTETPIDDEWHFVREPTTIRLKKGWNHVKLTMPKGDGNPEPDWCGVFLLLNGSSRHPCDVPDLEFSSDRQ